MENLILILGLFIGILVVFHGIACFGIGYLYRQNQKQQKQLVEAYRQIAANKKIFQTFSENYDKKVTIFAKKFALRNEQIFKRLSKLEKIPLPEHLSLTTQQVINKEVEKELHKQMETGTTFLDKTREKEIAAYNQEFHK